MHASLAWFVFFGVCTVVAGLHNVVTNLHNLARRRRIRATTAKSIVNTPGGGIVALAGRVVSDEDGVVIAPLSQRKVVWYRATIQRPETGGKPDSLALATEVDGRPFLISDDSGEVAHVIPTGAHVVVEIKEIGRSDTFHDVPPHIEAFAKAHGQSLLVSDSSIEKRDLVFYEETIAPGDFAYALGPSRRGVDAANNNIYRASGNRPLELFHPTEGKQELLLSNKTAERLLDELDDEYTGGLLLIGVGLFIIIGALVYGALT
ncbi:MAG TPA: hypothetical protein PK156_43295 [Polyangium sp.]|nr:hypothetical protein [Polyangium sp.]